ncbi:hypothetical protein NC651_026937 [Populus alba x Populus x berolinensis]|nr:hypothetical protein NC651_026937 [Populus alba x Populus x berolinensis]
MAQQAIQSRVRAKAVDHHEKYHGLPTLTGRSKKLVFSMARDKVLEKLKRLAGKSHPLPEKSIPTYILSCFLLPQVLCDELDSLG